MTKCIECGALYDRPTQAKYCAKTDLDPRRENQQLKDGTLASGWIPKPKG